MLFEKSFNHFSIHIYNNEQYHQKLKHSCNFDKKQRKKMFLSTMFKLLMILFIIELYIRNDIFKHI